MDNKRKCIRCSSEFEPTATPAKIHGNTRVCRQCYLIGGRKRSKTFREKHAEEERKRCKAVKIKFMTEHRERYLQRERDYGKKLSGVYNAYRKRAKKFKLEFNVSKDFFRLHWGGLCSYCGTKIVGAGFDRVENGIGYIESNMVPCCWNCNRKKRNFPLIVFLLRFLPSNRAT